jgi:hypothetical protein
MTSEPDATDQSFTRRNAYPQIAFLHRRAADAQQLGNFPTQRRDAFNHFQGGQACKAGMISLGNEWRAPIGHDAIANIFVDDAAVGPAVRT